MPEYIDREKYCAEVCRCNKEKCDKSKCPVWNAPAADVAPVIHGKWELRHEGYGHYWECSVCNTNPCIYVTRNTKFCPNCGAKMDLEDDE